MKDLIAKLQMDANCALGAIWMHIDAQAARIAELEAQQAFGIGETYANALSRIAELEAQIAAASTPVVEQKPVTNNGWLIDGSLVYKLDPTNTMNAFEINVTQAEGSRKHDGPRVELAKRILAWLTAPQPAVGADKVICANLGELLLTQAERKAANTDKLREVIKYSAGLRIAIENAASGYGEFIDGGLAEEIAKEVVTFLNFTTALQAPVREVPGWRPIETAPKDGSHILCYAPELQFVGFYGDPINKWCYMAPGVPIAPTQPTHWMPLPAAPVQKEEK